MVKVRSAAADLVCALKPLPSSLYDSLCSSRVPKVAGGCVKGAYVALHVRRGPTTTVAEGRQTLGQSACSKEGDHFGRRTFDLLRSQAELRARLRCPTLSSLLVEAGSIASSFRGNRGDVDHDVRGFVGAPGPRHRSTVSNSNAAPAARS